MLKQGKPLMRPSEVDLQVGVNVNNAAMVPRIGRWASRRWTSPIVSLLLITGLFGVALGNAMTLLGGPRAAFLGASGSADGRVMEVGSFTPSGSTGNQDVTIATDGTGFAAGTWAIVFWSTGSASASGTWAAEVVSTIGYVANGGGSLVQYAVGGTSLDALGTTATARIMAAAAIAYADDGGAASMGQATFVAFQTSTTMRLNWASATTRPVNYAIISGLTNAKVVNWTVPGTAIAKTVSVPGVDLSNDGLVFHAGAWMTAVPAASPEMYVQFGMMNSAGEQAGNAFMAGDAQAAAETARFQRADRVLMMSDETPSNRELAAYTSMTDEEFVVTYSGVQGGIWNMASLCMEGVPSKISSFTKTGSAAPVTQTVTPNQGWVPVGGFFSNIAAPAQATPYSHAIWSLGATDGTNERASALADINAADPTQADAVWYSGDVIVKPSATATTAALAGISNLAINSFDVDWSVNNGDSDEEIYCLIG